MVFGFGPIESEILTKIFIAAILGFAIGFERRAKHYGLGLRTSMLICIGACLFTMVGTSVFERTNLARVAQGLAAGVGFVGAAIIWKQKEGKMWVHGLTSAVSVWALTAVGFAVGAGEHFLAILATVVILIILLIKKAGVE